jgi:hypothetical protein
MDGNGADNVVHFPGNWIGPLEDLVPFGPSAERAAGADPLRLAADPSAMTDSPALSADAFWGEDAGSIHAVVQPPRGGAVTAGSATGTATGPGEAGLVTAGRAAPAIATGAAAVQVADGPGAPARGSRRTFARHASLGGAFAIARRTPTRTQVVVLTALLALSGSMFALLGRRVAPQHSPGATLGETPAARSRANTGTRNGAAVLALSEIETGIEDQAGLEASASGAASVPSSAAAESAARAARHEPHRSAAARSDSAASNTANTASNTANSAASSQADASTATRAAAATEPASNEAAPYREPTVSDGQSRAVSSGTSAVSNSGQSHSLDSASPLPVPGGPPAP